METCPIHHEAMQLRGAGTEESWYSHKTTDPRYQPKGWCNGKLPKVSGEQVAASKGGETTGIAPSNSVVISRLALIKAAAEFHALDPLKDPQKAIDTAAVWETWVNR